MNQGLLVLGERKATSEIRKAMPESAATPSVPELGATWFATEMNGVVIADAMVNHAEAFSKRLCLFSSLIFLFRTLRLIFGAERRKMQAVVGRRHPFRF